MWKPVLLTTAFFALAAGVCHNREDIYYAELGCRPAAVGGDGCPRSYDCGKISYRAQDKCYYKGRAYDKGYQLQQTDNPCLERCECEVSYATEYQLAFSCVSVECSELFQRLPYNCHYTYEPGECCHSGVVCRRTPEQKAAKTVCQYQSQEYEAGQQIYSEDQPCLQCICQAGFNGSLVEPFCQKINCNLELLYGHRIADGCIPVYYGENSCCPIAWRCPNKSDRVTSLGGYETISNNPELQCQFGDVKMQLGDKLSASSEWPNTECTCRVPPHPVCVQKN